MRASALVLLALGGALAFSTAPADPRESRTSYSGTLPPCADGSYLDCTDSPAMLIGGHSADAGDHSEVDTSLDESYLDQGKRCVSVEAYNGCIQKRTESPLCGGATWHDCDEVHRAMEGACECVTTATTLQPYLNKTPARFARRGHFASQARGGRPRPTAREPAAITSGGCFD